MSEESEEVGKVYKMIMESTEDLAMKYCSDKSQIENSYLKYLENMRCD